MDRTEELALIDRCLKHLAAKSAQQSEAVIDSPVSRYTDPARFRQEQARIFRPMPQIVAHTSQFSEPGSFVTTEIAGVPVLMIRGKDGEVRAFKNVCRHRGTLLESEVSGCRSRFQCPYHAWTYMLDGSLAGVPHAPRGFPELDRTDNGLVPLTTYVEFGFVWVQLEGPQLGSLRAFLGDFASDLEGFDAASAHLYGEATHTWEANWKLLAEGGLEAYHFQVAHEQTISKYFPNNVLIWDRSNDHMRMTFPKLTIAGLEGRPAEERRLVDHANVVYNFTPNTAFIHEKDHIVWLRTRPIAVDRSETTLRFLVPSHPDTWDEQQQKYWRINFDLTDRTLVEDFTLNQSSQRAIASGANEVFRFGRFEAALAEFNSMIESKLG
ncbi:hypothetical protein ABI59_17720 [Acidobacteria bacterium Mor1]|nr:hypothetical protein ABI59_17720 [Acidobacteria bacterium Mor1]